MSAPLPMTLRTRFQGLVEEGYSFSAAALRLKVSRATGTRRGRLIKKQGLGRPARQGRLPGSGKLAAYEAFFAALLAQDPNITLFELRDALEDAEVSACGRTKKEAGLMLPQGMSVNKTLGRKGLGGAVLK